METILTIAGVTLLVFVGLGILGSVLSFAKGLIRTFFSLAFIALIVTGVLWFMNGQQLPF